MQCELWLPETLPSESVHVPLASAGAVAVLGSARAEEHDRRGATRIGSGTGVGRYEDSCVDRLDRRRRRSATRRAAGTGRHYLRRRGRAYERRGILATGGECDDGAQQGRGENALHGIDSFDA